MKVINVILKVITGCMYFAGALAVLGTEGALTLDTINFKQFFVQLLIAAGICLVGYIINRLREYFVEDYLYTYNNSYDYNTWED